jgi:hypothetical protein
MTCTASDRQSALFLASGGSIRPLAKMLFTNSFWFDCGKVNKSGNQVTGPKLPKD